MHRAKDVVDETGGAMELEHVQIACNGHLARGSRVVPIEIQLSKQ